MEFLDLLFIVSFFVGLSVFCSLNKHLLMTLLSLEFLMLNVFFMITVYLSVVGCLYFSMVFLTFMVCEGALGLGILVSLVRFYGNDYFQSYANLVC
uniref:NADH-ubiquinone oxidoreductase chain 4L n=1 Tax=Myrmecophilus manni TaxID=270849 RepID=B6DE96_9ORTH|nr:NADH dehydrogenase subunit 4L [Myrmecophilus manni]ACG59292.1 NADH dehydrogenase subunit 4L [Myrmecophilus manni]